MNAEMETIEFITSLFAIGFVISFYPCWRIFRRAGYSPYWGMIVFILVLGPTVMLTILAFGKWPILKDTVE
jgi:hypothetical protein